MQVVYLENGFFFFLYKTWVTSRGFIGHNYLVECSNNTSSIYFDGS